MRPFGIPALLLLIQLDILLEPIVMPDSSWVGSLVMMSGWFEV